MQHASLYNGSFRASYYAFKSCIGPHDPRKSGIRVKLVAQRGYLVLDEVSLARAIVGTTGLKSVVR
jgi:hypothetical protein